MADVSREQLASYYNPAEDPAVVQPVQPLVMPTVTIGPTPAPHAAGTEMFRPFTGDEGLSKKDRAKLKAKELAKAFARGAAAIGTAGLSEAVESGPTEGRKFPIPGRDEFAAKGEQAYQKALTYLGGSDAKKESGEDKQDRLRAALQLGPNAQANRPIVADEVTITGDSSVPGGQGAIRTAGGYMPVGTGGGGGGGAGGAGGGKTRELSETVVKRGIPISPEVAGGIAMAGQHAQQAAESEYFGQQQRDIAAQRQAELNAQTQMATAQRMEQLAALKESAVQDHLTRMRTVQDEISRTKIDPDAYWKERGAGARVLGILAVGLGGFAAGLRGGGPNLPWQMLQTEIDRNVDAQVRNAQNLHRRADEENNIFRMHMDAFGDREKAIMATKNSYLEAIKAQMDEYVAKNGQGPESQSKYLKLLSKIEQTQAEIVDKLAARAEDEVTEKFVNELRTGGKGGGGGGAGGGGLNGINPNSPNWIAMAQRFGVKPDQLYDHMHKYAQESRMEAVDESLQDIDRLMTLIPARGHIPGVGPASKIPGYETFLQARQAAGDRGATQALNVRQAFAQIQAKERNKLFGASLTKNEHEAFNQIMSSGMTAEQFRASLSNLRQKFMMQKQRLDSLHPVGKAAYELTQSSPGAFAGQSQSAALSNLPVVE